MSDMPCSQGDVSVMEKVFLTEVNLDEYPDELAEVVQAAQPLAEFLGSLSESTNVAGIHLEVDAKNRVHTVELSLDPSNWVKFVWFKNSPQEVQLDSIQCELALALAMLADLCEAIADDQPRVISL